MLKFGCCLSLLAAAFLTGSQAIADVSDTDYLRMRKAKAQKLRKIVLNNDGCDSRGTFTKEEFLRRRTAFTPGMVDTIFYCVGHAGFQQIIGLKSGETSAYLKQNDVLQILIEFARKNNQEVFASFRMNDVHDWRHTEESPRMSSWKRSNRDVLFGKSIGEKSTYYGFWTALDHEQQKVRDQHYAVISEVLEKYDVDGIDLDFSRYLPLFKKVSCGIPATVEQREMMTDLLRKIRRKADEMGKKRNRAVLISVVLPDSFDYCRDLGADIETWIREGLIDIWSQPEMFQLNTWSSTIKLARKHGVTFLPQVGYPYPAERRQNTYLVRNIPEAYYAKAAAAYTAGATGLLYSDIPCRRALTTVIRRDASDLARLDKRYFVTPFQWEGCSSHLASGESHLKRPIVLPTNPYYIVQGMNTTLKLELGEDPDMLKKPNAPTVRAVIRKSGGSRLINISSNGKKWVRTGSESTYETFAIPAGALKKGVNDLVLTIDPKAKVSHATGLFMPLFENGKFRRHIYRWFKSEHPQAEKITPEGLLIQDSGKHDKDIANVAIAYNERGEAMNFAFECKVLSSDHDLAVCARAANGKHYETIALRTDRVKLLNSKFEYMLDTTEFHHYRLVLTTRGLIFYIDKQEVFRTNKLTRCTTPEACIKNFKTPATGIMNTISFIIGSLSGKGSGAAVWKSAAAGTTPGGVALADLALEFRYPENHPAGPKNLQWDKSSTGAMVQTAAGFGAEIVAVHPKKLYHWIISDGKHVTGYSFAPNGIRVYNSMPLEVMLDDKKQHKYQVVMLDDRPALYRDGKLLHHAFKPLDYKDTGFWRWADEFMTPTDFLKAYGKNFTAAQQNIIRNGGSFVTPETPGSIKSLKAGRK